MLRDHFWLYSQESPLMLLRGPAIWDIMDGTWVDSLQGKYMPMCCTISLALGSGQFRGELDVERRSSAMNDRILVTVLQTIMA